MLVTGGAGYIGSIVTEELLTEGNNVVVFDNLQAGHREAVDPRAVFVHGDLADIERLSATFRRYEIEAVVHMAADTLIEQSMKDPQRFFYSNVVYGLNLLRAMLEHGTDRIIFSSTAAVYGEPQTVPITEGASQEPINSYGESKLIFEKVLQWYHQAYGLKFASLRYFNACGASARFGEDHRPETHLIPIVLQVALGQRDRVHIFGTDYDTRDGTCVRDYIHVIDLAQAHILALKNLDRLGSRIYNLGNGDGYSVLEVIETCREVTAKEILEVPDQRRPGDPAVLVASSRRIRDELGWQRRYSSLHTIIETAWDWHRRYPNGYES